MKYKCNIFPANVLYFFLLTVSHFTPQHFHGRNFNQKLAIFQLTSAAKNDEFCVDFIIMLPIQNELSHLNFIKYVYSYNRTNFRFLTLFWHHALC